MKMICPLASTCPSATAIYPHLTYKDLNLQTAKATAYLKAQGIQENDLVVLPAIQDESTLCFLFATWRLKAYVLLISPERLQLKTSLEFLPPHTILQDRASFLHYKPHWENNLCLTRRSLFLLTSGSSGTPKCATFTLSALFQSAYHVIHALPIPQRSRLLLSIPLFHVGGLGVMLRSILTESMLIFEDKKLPRFERVSLGNPDFASLVPTQLYRLLACNPPPITTHFIIGGAPLSSSLYQQALEKGLTLSLTYGLTELSSTVILSKHPVWKGPLPYLGFPLAGHKLSLQHQELFAEGDTLFSGYMGEDLVTPFPTKDLAIYDETLGFLICGRKDSQFFSGGENIQPEEIEAVLLSHPKVEQALVVPLYDEEYGASPIAWVQTNLSKKELQSFAAKFLPKYKIPTSFLSLCTQNLASQNVKLNRLHLTEVANKQFTTILNSNISI